ncbi:GNAT family N-acetyltransferase [Ureibacillus sinduriensis]|uniref:GCN5 family acetyltransferase n=1 Tax=Ureibacillus sinduriensis BLB-1 = JCM 15800 TaxID=1384057 RepID=A0A0A3HY50_9BACL|nr:GNAT family N-acetyltransferase [Ureibacillus sinduriensis]KGR76170.1 GCN5 family acetyltransferase [Ureibacillus sinduriensis BLB-1 = JCM 15800]
MITKIDMTNPKLVKEVLDIQLASYKVEAEIIDFHELPPLKDTVETLQRCTETFFGYYLEGELCGVISVKMEEGIIDIHRLMVHPNHFRKGIAKKLLNFIESNNEGFKAMIVSTGSKNTPAVTFYLKNGFSIMEETKITESLSITSFKKNI